MGSHPAYTCSYVTTTEIRHIGMRDIDTQLALPTKKHLSLSFTLSWLPPTQTGIVKVTKIEMWGAVASTPKSTNPRFIRFQMKVFSSKSPSWGLWLSVWKLLKVYFTKKTNGVVKIVIRDTVFREIYIKRNSISVVQWRPSVLLWRLSLSIAAEGGYIWSKLPHPSHTGMCPKDASDEGESVGMWVLRNCNGESSTAMHTLPSCV